MKALGPLILAIAISTPISASEGRQGGCSHDAQPVGLAIGMQGEMKEIRVTGQSDCPVSARFVLIVDAISSSRHSGIAHIDGGAEQTFATVRLPSGVEWFARLEVTPESGETYTLTQQG